MIRTVIPSTCTAVLALALASSAPAAAGTFQPSQVPASADVVIHFDVDQFNHSRLHKIFAREIAAGTKQLDAALAAKGMPITAADLLSIGSLTFWAEGSDPERGAMIVNGVNAKRLLRAATKLPNFKIARHGGYVLSRINVDGDDTFVGAMRSTLVIADSKEAVARTLDAMTRKSRSLAGSKTAQRLSQTGGMLVAGAFGDVVAKKIRQQAGSPMFKNIELRRGAVFASEQGNGLAIRAVLEHASSAGADRLVKIGQGLLAMASIGSPDPDLTKLVQSIRLSSSGKRATIDLRVPYKMIRKLHSKGAITL